MTDPPHDLNELFDAATQPSGMSDPGGGFIALPSWQDIANLQSAVQLLQLKVGALEDQVRKLMVPALADEAMYKIITQFGKAEEEQKKTPPGGGYE